VTSRRPLEPHSLCQTGLPADILHGSERGRASTRRAVAVKHHHRACNLCLIPRHFLLHRLIRRGAWRSEFERIKDAAHRRFRPLGWREISLHLAQDKRAGTLEKITHAGERQTRLSRMAHLALQDNIEWQLPT
jgi:hypothetical protein